MGLGNAQQDLDAKSQGVRCKKPPAFYKAEGLFGGAKRDRTVDLYNAIVALSQLSYGPVFLGRGVARVVGRGYKGIFTGAQALFYGS